MNKNFLFFSSCDTCGSRFGAKHLLRHHTLIHMIDKPYKCSHCTKSFTTNAVLQAHLLAIHSGNEYAFKCDQCDNAYRWKTDLRNHYKAYHLGKFPYVCKFCGKGYTSGSSKNYHQSRCSQGNTLNSLI